MIGAIRRRFKPVEGDVWDTDRALGTEVEEPSEPYADAVVLQAAAQPGPGYFPGDQSLADYYKGIVMTAIENNGRYRNHRIPVPWLRMILAGLESRYIDPDLLWYEAGVGSTVTSQEDLPSYEELFPQEGDLAARLR